MWLHLAPLTWVCVVLQFYRAKYIKIIQPFFVYLFYSQITQKKQHIFFYFCDQLFIDTIYVTQTCTSFAPHTSTITVNRCLHNSEQNTYQMVSKNETTHTHTYLQQGTHPYPSSGLKKKKKNKKKNKTKQTKQNKTKTPCLIILLWKSLQVLCDWGHHIRDLFSPTAESSLFQIFIGGGRGISAHMKFTRGKM